MELIDKAAIVAELKRRIDFSDKLANATAKKNLHNTVETHELLIAQYGSLLNFINTLEIKEVYEHNNADLDRIVKELGVEPDSRLGDVLKKAYYRAIDKYLMSKEE